MITNPLLGTFSPQLFAIAYGGIPLRGLADADDAVKIEHESDAWDWEVGADGEVMRTQTVDYRASVTISFMPTSTSIAILEAMRAADQATGKGAKSLVLVDLSSGSVWNSASTFIKRAPDRSFGKKAGPVEYIFQCSALLENVMGIQQTPVG